MSEAENKLLARRLLEQVGNTGAVDRLPEFLASDCTVRHTNSQGLAWFREHLLTFHRCYPEMEGLMELGVVKWAGGQPGAPPSGDPAALPGNSGITEEPPSVS